MNYKSADFDRLRRVLSGLDDDDDLIISAALRIASLVTSEAEKGEAEFLAALLAVDSKPHLEKILGRTTLDAVRAALAECAAAGRPRKGDQADKVGQEIASLAIVTINPGLPDAIAQERGHLADAIAGAVRRALTAGLDEVLGYLAAKAAAAKDIEQNPGALKDDHDDAWMIGQVAQTDADFVRSLKYKPESKPESSA